MVAETESQWWDYDVGKVSDHTRGDGDDFILLEHNFVFGTEVEAQQYVDSRIKHWEAFYSDWPKGSDDYPYFCSDQGNFALDWKITPTGNSNVEDPKYQRVERKTNKIERPSTIADCLLLFGPGGIGKSNVDSIVRNDVLRINPYRLRPSGPRDTNDVFYAHQNLRDELSCAFKNLGESCRCLSENPAVNWFPKAKVAFFQVRGEWQCLLLGGLSGQRAKAEIYAPVVPILLANPAVRALFAKLSIVILNPVAPLDKLRNSDDLKRELKEKTQKNCSLRKDDPGSIKRRMESIDEEVEAWWKMLNLCKIGFSDCQTTITEYSNWKFPEHVYSTDRVKNLRAARDELINGNDQLESFLKADADIVAQS